MTTEPVFRVVNVIFASLIFVQSIIWGVLSLLAILCTHGLLKLEANHFTHWVYSLYMSGASDVPNDSRVFPNEFFIYVFWPFFLFSLFLAFTSSAHLVHVAQHVKRNKMNVSAKVLVILTFLSCVYDAVATIIFAIDYVRIRDFEELQGKPIELEYRQSVPLIMMTLAAKGYILWLVNFVLAIWISVLLKKETTPEDHEEPDEHVFSRTNSGYEAFGDAVLSNGMEEPQNGRRPTQFHRSPAHVNPYAQTEDDAHSTTTSWAEMPQIYLEPFDSIAPQATVEFVPQSHWFGSTPNLNMAEPEPDYSPAPNRRLGMNHNSSAADNVYGTR